MSHYSVCFKLSHLNSSFARLFSTLLIWKQGSCLPFHCHTFNAESSAWHRIRTPYILSEQMHFEWINEVIPNTKILTPGEKITPGKLVGETCRKVIERRARANILLSFLFPHCSCFWVGTLLHLELLKGGLQPISIQFQLILMGSNLLMAFDSYCLLCGPQAPHQTQTQQLTETTSLVPTAV